MTVRTWRCEHCSHEITYHSTLVLDHDARKSAQAHMLAHGGAS